MSGGEPANVAGGDFLPAFLCFGPEWKRKPHPKPPTTKGREAVPVTGTDGGRSGSWKRRPVKSRDGCSLPLLLRPLGPGETKPAGARFKRTPSRRCLPCGGSRRGAPRCGGGGGWGLPLHVGGVRGGRRREEAHGALLSSTAAPLQLGRSPRSMNVWRSGGQGGTARPSHV